MLRGSLFQDTLMKALRGCKPPPKLMTHIKVFYSRFPTTTHIPQ